MQGCSTTAHGGVPLGLRDLHRMCRWPPGMAKDAPEWRASFLADGIGEGWQREMDMRSRSVAGMRKHRFKAAFSLAWAGGRNPYTVFAALQNHRPVTFHFSRSDG